MNKQDAAVSGTEASSTIFINSWIADVISVNTIPVYVQQNSKLCFGLETWWCCLLW